MSRNRALLIPMPVDKTSDDYKHLTQLAKDRIAEAERLHLYANLMAYYTFLDNMKFYQQKHLPDYPHILDGFYSIDVFRRTQERNLLNDADVNYVFQIMQNLSAFVNLMPKDSKSWLYEDSRASFLNIVLLTQEMINVAKPMNTGAAATTGQVQFQKRMSALSATVASTTDYIQHRFDTTKQVALLSSLNNMRLLAEGQRAKSAKDHPWLNGFMGAMYTLSGLMFVIAGVMVCAVNPLLGAMKITLGAGFISAGLADIARSCNPYFFFGKEEKKMATQSAATGAALFKLSTAPSALFSKQKLPHSTQVAPMVELQQLRPIRI